MRAPLFVLGVLLCTACGQAALLPDGGRPRNVCAAAQGNVPVKVVDGKGQPIEAVTVTATQIGTGKTATAQTDVNGVTEVVNADLGDGTIHVMAQLGQKSALADVTMTCGECICTGYPAAVTLTLQ